MKKILVVAAIAFLSACASNVQSPDVKVEDKKAIPTVAANTGTSTPAAQTTITAQDLVATNPAGPVDTAKVIYFDFDSFAIKAEFQSVLVAHAKYLRENAKTKISIGGHTDERGGREYNVALGQKRAEAVKKALSLLGASENQMEAVSFGEEKPALAGQDESAYAKNRRAELTYR